MNPKINLLDVPILERKDINGRRHYISRNDDGKIESGAVSTTSINREAMPLNPYLEKWKFGLGELECKRVMDISAYFGTIEHIVLGDLTNGLPVMLGESDIEKYFGLNKLEKSEGGLPEYHNVRLPASANGKNYGYKRFRRDAISINQFIQDHLVGDNIEVIGIELPLADFVRGFAGCMDLVVKVGLGEYDEETKLYEDYIYIIYDLKSGDGHYDEHDVQLNSYQRLLSNYLDIPLDKITMYDVHMKDWNAKTYKKYLDGTSTTAPYKLVEVKYSEMFEYYLQGYYMRNEQPNFDKKEIDYDCLVEDVVKQFKGEVK